MFEGDSLMLRSKAIGPNRGPRQRKTNISACNSEEHSAAVIGKFSHSVSGGQSVSIATNVQATNMALAKTSDKTSIVKIVVDMSGVLSVERTGAGLVVDPYSP